MSKIVRCSMSGFLFIIGISFHASTVSAQQSLICYINPQIFCNWNGTENTACSCPNSGPGTLGRAVVPACRNKVTAQILCHGIYGPLWADCGCPNRPAGDRGY